MIVYIYIDIISINHYNSSPSHPSRLPTSPEAEVTEDSVDPEATDIASLPAGPRRAKWGERWENHGKTLGKWENHGKIMEIVGKLEENDQNCRN